jgi:hypothetical protein
MKVLWHPNKSETFSCQSAMILYPHQFSRALCGFKMGEGQCVCSQVYC